MAYRRFDYIYARGCESLRTKFYNFVCFDWLAEGVFGQNKTRNRSIWSSYFRCTKVIVIWPFVVVLEYNCSAIQGKYSVSDTAKFTMYAISLS